MLLNILSSVNLILQFIDHSAPNQDLLDLLWEIFFLHDGGLFFDQFKYYVDDQSTRSETENPVYLRATRQILAYLSVSI